MDAPMCRLCGAPLPGGDSARCPNCGLHPARDLGRAGYRKLALGLAAVYGLTALAVFLGRGH
jgi:hypothetical protein